MESCVTPTGTLNVSSPSAVYVQVSTPALVLRAPAFPQGAAALASEVTRSELPNPNTAARLTMRLNADNGLKKRISVPSD
jgi:hypothetical protein